MGAEVPRKLGLSPRLGPLERQRKLGRPDPAGDKQKGTVVVAWEWGVGVLVLFVFNRSDLGSLRFSVEVA